MCSEYSFCTAASAFNVFNVSNREREQVNKNDAPPAVSIITGYNVCSENGMKMSLL